mmetsp:Transcript_9638/g.21934  ORF Transcript_9638/g.21934 Transcript_9638/m.21934 type:complete len:317 (-) Transcript_9638:388-1338(-)
MFKDTSTTRNTKKTHPIVAFPASCAHHISCDQFSSVTALNAVYIPSPTLFQQEKPKSGQTGSTVSIPLVHGWEVPCRRQPTSPVTGSVYSYGLRSIDPSGSTRGVQEQWKPAEQLNPSLAQRAGDGIWRYPATCRLLVLTVESTTHLALNLPSRPQMFRARVAKTTRQKTRRKVTSMKDAMLTGKASSSDETPFRLRSSLSARRGRVRRKIWTSFFTPDPLTLAMGIRIQLMSTMKESSRFQALAKYPASSGSTVEDRGGLKPTPSAAILRNISAVNTETMIQSKILLMSLSLDVGLKSSLMSFMAISTVLKNISP